MTGRLCKMGALTRRPQIPCCEWSVALQTCSCHARAICSLIRSVRFCISEAMWLCVPSQWMACGLAGPPGQNAQQPVAVDTTWGPGHAQTQPQPMAETSAWGCTRKRLSATHSPALVSGRTFGQTSCPLDLETVKWIMPHRRCWKRGATNLALSPLPWFQNRCSAIRQFSSCLSSRTSSSSWWWQSVYKMFNLRMKSEILLWKTRVGAWRYLAKLLHRAGLRAVGVGSERWEWLMQVPLNQLLQVLSQELAPFSERGGGALGMKWGLTLTLKHFFKLVPAGLSRRFHLYCRVPRNQTHSCSEN